MVGLVSSKPNARRVATSSAVIRGWPCLGPAVGKRIASMK